MGMIGKILAFSNKKRKESQEQCYNENKNAKGICYGVYGGDSYTHHLSYACIGCPYHTPYFREVEDGNGR